MIQKWQHTTNQLAEDIKNYAKGKVENAVYKDKTSKLTTALELLQREFKEFESDNQNFCSYVVNFLPATLHHSVSDVIFANASSEGLKRFHMYLHSH